jgi:hypothetical protein
VFGGSTSSRRRPPSDWRRRQPRAQSCRRYCGSTVDKIFNRDQPGPNPQTTFPQVRRHMPVMPIKSHLRGDLSRPTGQLLRSKPLTCRNVIRAWTNSW